MAAGGTAAIVGYTLKRAALAREDQFRFPVILRHSPHTEIRPIPGSDASLRQDQTGFDKAFENRDADRGALVA